MARSSLSSTLNKVDFPALALPAMTVATPFLMETDRMIMTYPYSFVVQLAFCLKSNGDNNTMNLLGMF